ncbi:hypothetical protein ABW20_dc0107308 [Dactylellina cionopaga]|nr:hypothetical protein ABW20_dc0107308 [Dactylellina cionopaga]
MSSALSKVLEIASKALKDELGLEIPPAGVRFFWGWNFSLGQELYFWTFNPMNKEHHYQRGIVADLDTNYKFNAESWSPTECEEVQKLIATGGVIPRLEPLKSVANFDPTMKQVQDYGHICPTDLQRTDSSTMSFEQTAATRTFQPQYNDPSFEDLLEKFRACGQKATQRAFEMVQRKIVRDGNESDWKDVYMFLRGTTQKIRSLADDLEDWGDAQISENGGRAEMKHGVENAVPISELGIPKEQPKQNRDEDDNFPADEKKKMQEKVDELEGKLTKLRELIGYTHEAGVKLNKEWIELPEYCDPDNVLHIVNDFYWFIRNLRRKSDKIFKTKPFAVNDRMNLDGSV